MPAPRKGSPSSFFSLSQLSFPSVVDAEQLVDQSVGAENRGVDGQGGLEDQLAKRLKLVHDIWLLKALAFSVIRDATCRDHDASYLPLKDDVQHGHFKVQELRDLSRWSDAHFWVLPEQHGNLVRGRLGSLVENLSYSLFHIRALPPLVSSVPMAYTQFTDDTMLPSGNRDRIVDCMEELVKYTVIMRPCFDLFGDQYSERAERRAKEALTRQVAKDS
ncbi:MAG: hypothetical protein Q9207_001541 [Kuettlingeria erythrocarpa]